MRWNVMRLCAVLATASACGGGGGGGTGTQDPVFTSLSVDPPSLSVAVGAISSPLVATPRDQRGAAMAGLPAASFTSSNEARATVSSTGAVTGVSAGTATVTASLAHLGVTRTNTAAITVTSGEEPAPMTASVAATLSSTFNPPSVRIARTGTVTWTWAGLDHNVLFTSGTDRPADIPTRSTGSVSRDFNTAGTFNYRCSIHAGMEGTVLVDP